MRFTKWQGLGNDFVIINTFEETIYDERELAKAMCDRHFGIGADGLVLIAPSDTADFQMRIINSDGTYAEMCGNATRCVASYLKSRGMSDGGSVRLETLAGVVEPRVLDGEDNLVEVNMGKARLLRGEIPMQGDEEDTAINIPLEVNGWTWYGTGVSMGNPHFVIFVDNLAQIALEDWGPRIERHPMFPHKTNVEFVQRINAGKIRMRVWERGCGITMACGTGSCASVVAGVLTQRTDRDVTVILDGGELMISYKENGIVTMTGPAVEVFSGNWS
ncbi:MAG: diaminopimelate epimerase [Victivallaceae bacterium]